MRLLSPRELQRAPSLSFLRTGMHLLPVSSHDNKRINVTPTVGLSRANHPSADVRGMYSVISHRSPVLTRQIRVQQTHGKRTTAMLNTRVSRFPAIRSDRIVLYKSFARSIYSRRLAGVFPRK